MLPLSVTNPFDEPATFKISMTEIKPPLDLSLGSAAAGGAGGAKAPGRKGAAAAAVPMPAGGALDEDDPSKRLPNSFFCANATLTLEAGGSAELPVQFLPFQLGEYTSTLLFSDPQVGD